MDRVKANAIALRDECERLARQAERKTLDPSLTVELRIQAQDQAKAYWQMRGNHADTVYHAERVRPERHTGRNKGTQEKTKTKIEFIRKVSAELGTSNREAIASQAVERHPSRVRSLWRAEGDKARRKVLNFMKNQKIP